MLHPAQLSTEELLKDCQIEMTRRGGPGGQNRNKVETAVIMTHLPTKLRSEANEKRTQGENRDQALFRLRLLLAVKVRVLWEGTPSERWLERVKASRLEISSTHDDFPALIAEALDALESAGYDTPQAARSLGISSSQLVKLLTKHNEAFASFNQKRVARGMKPLHFF